MENFIRERVFMKIKSSACSRTKISEIKTYLALWTQKKIKLVNSKIAQ